MTGPSPDCWLFLNCESMTGYPAEQCPNRKRCKRNAKHSENRACELPYSFQQFDPEFDQLFGSKECRLTVGSWIEKEAIDAGWHPAEKLFWTYKDNVLSIGQTNRHHFLKIPPGAKERGFARAEPTPYGLGSGPERLVVTGYQPRSCYPQHFLEAGWHPAVDLPFSLINEPPFKGLYVSFSIDTEAIAAGWHPAEELHQYTEDEDFYD